MGQKILGFEIEDWVEMLDTEEAKLANKSLKYYDGRQEEEMIKLLNCPYKGRKDWKNRGIIPRWRNITQMVVEKSGKLFKDQAPIIEVYSNNNINEIETDILTELLYKANWLEFFNNHDSVTRLLKNGIVLTQWDIEEQCPVFETLHRGNCVIITDTYQKNVLGLIYKTSEYGKVETYRIITKDEYIDLVEVEEHQTSKVSISSRIPNPYKIVPITIFYDTRLPRTGIWNEPGADLISINELYNLHLTDSEQAIHWSKFPKLIMIDCDLGEEESETEQVIDIGDKMPRLRNKQSDIVAGPAKAISLRSFGNGNASIEYKTPTVNIEPLDLVIQNWIEQFSYDWSVRLNVAGQGSANSGFQLVVEELPNTELRQQRARMMEYGFKRLFKVLKTIINIQMNRIVFGDESELYITFPNPKLPVNEVENEDVWQKRIDGNRATIIDYLMEVKGLDKVEAEIKYKEIQELNKSIQDSINSPVDINNLK